MTKEQVLTEFRKAGALLDGHFVLRSGLHSRQFFQCALLLQYPKVAGSLCDALAEKVRHLEIDSVISPALGGLFVGHEMGRALDRRHIFAEKEEGKLVLRRGFKVSRGERFLVAEDVVTQGGRVRETIAIVKELGGIVAGIVSLVDRSPSPVDFGSPFISLVKMDVETFHPDQIPSDLQNIPAIKPGSK